MGFFKGIVKLGINIVSIPVPVVMDIITLGGVQNDHGSYTLKHIQKAKDDAEAFDD